MARRYRFLEFAPGVDWRHVNPTLLARVNRLGMYLGKVIRITSGARGTPANPNTGASGSHHVPANNPSGVGEAVDAYIGGKQIGEVVKEKTLARFGLYSGNRPGFYKGKPDPMHLETLERRGLKYSGTDAIPSDSGGQDAAAAASTQAPADVMATLPQPSTTPPGAPPMPEETHPFVGAPGSQGTEDFNPRRIAATWQLIASQPLSSPEAQMFAQNAATATGGQ